MSRIMLLDLLALPFLWTKLRKEPMMKAYITNQLLTATTLCLTLVCCLSYIWLHVSWCIKSSPIPQLNWSEIVGAWPYIKAGGLIVIAYLTLLAVNTRYIRLFFIPIVMLVFLGILFVRVYPKCSLKSKKASRNEANKADDPRTASEANGNGGVGNKDNVLFATEILPCWVLCCMGHFNVDNLVVSQFLLFLSSALGELTQMMASLPSEVAPASEVVRRASLVVVLVTAHTMAAEILGDDVVLVCTPELITALIWFSIHFGNGDKDSATASVDKATSYKAGLLVFSAVLAILACLAASTDESSEATILLSSYMGLSVACAFSVILLTLCVFAQHEWPGQTTAARPSELEGAIRLLTFCRNILFVAAAMFLLVAPFVDVRLGLQLQGLAAEILNKFSIGSEKLKKFSIRSGPHI